jgi:hypothetical protein
MTLCTFGPPAERRRRWILKFEDTDASDMHFTDEAEAHAMFNRCSLNWTCTLFVTAEINSAMWTAAQEALSLLNRVPSSPSDDVPIETVRENLRRALGVPY